MKVGDVCSFDFEVQCYEILRMNQKTFRRLCKILSEKYGLVETLNIYNEESVAMFVEMG